jgi:glycosyltransferase involved in cell wall biosynthesis
MKIAFVSHVLPPSWSGQSVMIGRILRNIPSTQYCLISIENYRDENEGNIGYLPGKYFVLPKDPEIFYRRANNWILSWLRAFFRGVNIARIVKREKCDIIVAASGNLIDIPAGWWASVFTSARYVPYFFDDYLYQWADEQTRSITRKMEKHIFGRVKIVIVPNEFMRDAIEKRENVKAVIVRNPCATTPVNEHQPLTIDYDPRAEIRIIYTGAIYHVNFDAFKSLIKATSQIPVNIKIHIYTAQPPDWLEQNGVKGAQIVHHHHSLHEEAMEAQNHAHILFLPFSFNSPIPEVIQTSAPGKTGEYLNSGVPILAHVPPDTFISWYLRKYDCGYIVDTDEIDSLKKGIENLINDPVLRQRLVSNAKERARIDFDPIVASRAFVQALEMAL